ncbi:MAG: alpha/beta hydrolase family protein [Candidatus Nucleicultricaceae bacterium]
MTFLRHPSAFIMLIIILAIGSNTSDATSKTCPGTITIDYMDTNRNRPLVADIYYPTHDHTSCSTPVSINVVPPQAPQATPLKSKTPYPLIILSHGYGCARDGLSWLATKLAQDGYMVAALEHFGNSANFNIDNLALQYWLRPQDVSVFLDFFLKDPHWSSLINKEQIGFAGFSLGGLTGLWLAGGMADRFAEEKQKKMGIDASPAKNAYRDTRIKAVFLMAPAYGSSFSPDSLNAITIPVFIAATRKDDRVSFEENAQYLSREIKGASLKVFEGPLFHMIFDARKRPDVLSCGPHSPAEDTEAQNTEKVQQETNDLAVRFFNENLRSNS